MAAMKKDNKLRRSHHSLQVLHPSIELELCLHCGASVIRCHALTNAHAQMLVRRNFALHSASYLLSLQSMHVISKVGPSMKSSVLETFACVSQYSVCYRPCAGMLTISYICAKVRRPHVLKFAAAQMLCCNIACCVCGMLLVCVETTEESGRRQLCLKNVALQKLLNSACSALYYRHVQSQASCSPCQAASPPPAAPHPSVPHTLL